MDDKRWALMTTEQKVEELRKEFDRIASFINQMKAVIGQDEHAIGELFTRLEKLEKKG